MKWLCSIVVLVALAAGAFLAMLPAPPVHERTFEMLPRPNWGFGGPPQPPALIDISVRQRLENGEESSLVVATGVSFVKQAGFQVFPHTVTLRLSDDELEAIERAKKRGSLHYDFHRPPTTIMGTVATSAKVSVERWLWLTEVRRRGMLFWLPEQR